MHFDWHTFLGIVSSILLLALLIPYIRSIVTSTTRPSAVSWFGWTLLFAVAGFAQASRGIDWSLAILVISGLSSLTIAIVALRLGRAVWTSADGICIALGVDAILFWMITDEPLTAIVLSVIADFSVTVPTLVKTFHDPSSEPAALWTLYVVGVALEIIATEEYTIYNLLFPTYTLIAATMIAALALRGKIRPQTSL